MWKLKVPFKVSLFLWTATLGKIFAIDNLLKRRLLVLDWCCMCKREGETIDHLFLHCSVAKGLWDLVFSMSHDRLGDAQRGAGIAVLLA